MMFYLAQKYRGIELQAFDNACKWTKQLLDKGYYVLSPILHSHPFSLEVGNKVKGQCYGFDNCQCYTESKDESGIDWLEWDIKILEALHKGDGCIGNKDCVCGHASITNHPEEICACGRNYERYISFDSGLTMIFAPDCVKIQYIESKDGIQLGSLKEIEDANETKLLWYSVGAETEYKWAKEHHVKCVLLEDVLNKPENEWRSI